ncbi:MAG: Fis family transcriptional regulator, partial [Actinomycetota bacterium]|nr:Fis family transcriptional regulator [Actinomycetota bacterium]
MGDGGPPSRSRLRRDIERDLSGAVAEGSAVPRRVLASWQRCEEYGLPLDSIDPAFSGTYDDDSLFYACGVEVLTGLQATLADEPVSLMLTDGEGLVLNRLSGDGGLLRALDDVRLAPGFTYAERDVGTSGLGLALADRAPVVVEADQHYSVTLHGYTCAAAPVLDPLTGRLQGSVNLTTWSQSSSGLLLALAQSAAANTSALMLARSRGLAQRTLPRGEVTRVEATRREPGAGTITTLSTAWTGPLDRAVAEVAAGRVVLALGEPRSGRTTLLAQALRRGHPRLRVLSARTPAAQDVEAWLSLWTPELGKPDTAVVVGDVDTLPSWAAQHLRDVLGRVRAAGGASAVSFTAETAGGLPGPLVPLVDTAVVVPPLRERPDDVLPLAEHLTRRARGRDVAITPR